jgi:hypothetical protein
MKKILLFLIVFAAYFHSFGQLTGGVKGGFNFATLSGADDAKLRASIHLGGYLNYPISDMLSFQPELLYSSVGAKFSESGSEPDGFGGTAEYDAKQTVKLNYLSIPLMFRYNVGSVNLEAGPQLAFFMAGKVKTKVEWSYMGESGSETETEDADGVNSLDLGLNIGVNKDFDKLNVGLRYSLGLTNINDGDDKVTNNVLQLSASYKLFEK